MLAYLASGTVFGDGYSNVFVKIQRGIEAKLKLPLKIEQARNVYDDQAFEKLFLHSPTHTYRLIIKDAKEVSFSSKPKANIAFDLIFEKKARGLNLQTITDIIHADHEALLNRMQTSEALNPSSLFEEDPLTHNRDIISTSDILSWNRMLKNAYQGNLALSASSSGSSSGDASEQQAGQASTGGNQNKGMAMAKMMNQCGGNNKSHAAHQRSMQNIAEALVMAQSAAASGDGSAKPKAGGKNLNTPQASQAYTDASSNYKRQERESVLEALERIQNIDMSQTYQNLQTEKRIIEKGIQRNEIDYIFSQSPADQASFFKLQKLIKSHNRLTILKQFQLIGRKLILSKAHANAFANDAQKKFLYDSAKKRWAVNPLIQDKEGIREVLIDILEQHMTLQVSPAKK